MCTTGLGFLRPNLSLLKRSSENNNFVLSSEMCALNFEVFNIVYNNTITRYLYKLQQNIK